MIDCRSHGNEWSGSTPGNEQAVPAILSGIGIRQLASCRNIAITLKTPQ